MMRVKKNRLERSIEFGERLRCCRVMRGINQTELGQLVGRSASYIQKIEYGRIGHDFIREEVWKIISFLNVFPPDCDGLMRTAGYSADRTGTEERDLQMRMPFTELWVYARQILDSEPEWYEVVRRNILLGRKHCYFTADPGRFYALLTQLQDELEQADVLSDQLECIVLPPELFLTNFALYIPETRGQSVGKVRVYGCGTKPDLGETHVFYTMYESEAADLYKKLQRWRERALWNQDTTLDPMRLVYPPGSTMMSRFISTNPAQ